MKHFGKHLIKLRKEKGLSQQDLANLSGLSRRIIAYYENEDKINSLDKIEKIAKALNIPILKLLQFSEQQKKQNNVLSNLDTRTIKKIKQLLFLSRQDRSIVYKFIETLSNRKKKTTPRLKKSKQDLKKSS